MVDQSRVVWEPPRGPFLKSIHFSENGAGASEEDIRTGSRGAFIFPFFEWTFDENEAVRGFVLAVNGGAPPGYELINFDLNKGARGTFNYLCVRRQGNEPPVSKVTFLKFSHPFRGTEYNEWKVFPQDLIVNGRGKYVYVAYQQAQGHQKTVTEKVAQLIESPVTKFHEVQKQRTVTKYRTFKWKVNRTVEYFLTTGDFYQLALDQVLAEIRGKFASTGAQSKPTPKEEPLTKEAPLDSEELLPKEEPVPSELVPNEEPLPSEEPLPNGEVPNEEPLPKEAPSEEHLPMAAPTEIHKEDANELQPQEKLLSERKLLPKEEPTKELQEEFFTIMMQPVNIPQLARDSEEKVAEDVTASFARCGDHVQAGQARGSVSGT